MSSLLFKFDTDTDYSGHFKHLYLYHILINAMLSFLIQKLSHFDLRLDNFFPVLDDHIFFILCVQLTFQ